MKDFDNLINLLDREAMKWHNNGWFLYLIGGVAVLLVYFIFFA